eukprot:1268582-Rhodomonas_salina.2
MERHYGHAWHTWCVSCKGPVVCARRCTATMSRSRVRNPCGKASSASKRASPFKCVPHAIPECELRPRQGVQHVLGSTCEHVICPASKAHAVSNRSRGSLSRPLGRVRQALASLTNAPSTRKSTSVSCTRMSGSPPPWTSSAGGRPTPWSGISLRQVGSWAGHSARAGSGLCQT